MGSLLLQRVQAVVAERGVVAVLFDWDGTYADSGAANFAAMERVVAPAGVQLDARWFAERSGVSSKEMLRTLLGDGPSDDQLDALAQRRDEYFADHRDAVAPFGDADEVLRWCRRQGIAVAVASGGSRPVIEALVDDWQVSFDALVTRVDVQRGKPDPEIFLLSADRLGVAPERCLVLEDSEQGIEAAHRAGMACLDVRESR